jgi:hypothetical protein
MIWNEDSAYEKEYLYLAEYNQFMQPKPYRCIFKKDEENSPWSQTGIWCSHIYEAMEQGNIHNERLIEE